MVDIRQVHVIENEDREAVAYFTELAEANRICRLLNQTKSIRHHVNSVSLDELSGAVILNQYEAVTYDLMGDAPRKGIRVRESIVVSHYTDEVVSDVNQHSGQSLAIGFDRERVIQTIVDSIPPQYAVVLLNPMTLGFDRELRSVVISESSNVGD